MSHVSRRKKKGGSFGDVKSDVYPQYPPGATAQVWVWGESVVSLLEVWMLG